MAPAAAVAVTPEAQESVGAKGVACTDSGRSSKPSQPDAPSAPSIRQADLTKEVRMNLGNIELLNFNRRLRNAHEPLI